MADQKAIRNTVLGALGSILLFYMAYKLILLDYSDPFTALWILTPLLTALYIYRGHSLNIKYFIFSITALTALALVFAFIPFAGFQVSSYFGVMLVLPLLFLVHGYLTEIKSLQKAYYYISLGIGLSLFAMILNWIIPYSQSNTWIIVGKTVPFTLISLSILLFGFLARKGYTQKAKRGYIYLATSAGLSVVLIGLLLVFGGQGGDMAAAFSFVSSVLVFSVLTAFVFIWSSYTYLKIYLKNR